MMKKKALICISLMMMIVSTVCAQSSNTYITHTLKNGETLSALAKQFNTTVGDIMRLNGMHADSKLVVGSNVKIPSSAAANIDEPVKPVVPEKPAEIIADKQDDGQTHTVQKGETVFGISKQYNISIDELKDWNNLNDNSLDVGQVLIVTKNGIIPPQVNGNADITKKEVSVDSDVKTDATTVAPPDDSSKKEKLNKKTQKAASKILEDKPAGLVAALYGNEGYFAESFGKDTRRNKIQTVSGQAMSFKTEAGWDDHKYYVLMNDVVIGTIVKITAANGKIAYAKVLWNLGDMKENAGLTCRVSNAAAAALGINESIFAVDISYY